MSRLGCSAVWKIGLSRHELVVYLGGGKVHPQVKPRKDQHCASRPQQHRPGTDTEDIEQSDQHRNSEAEMKKRPQQGNTSSTCRRTVERTIPTLIPTRCITKKPSRSSWPSVICL